MFGSNLFGPTITNAVNAGKTGLTFSKILGGAGKTLNFVNKAIPVYYQIKPMFANAKTLINMYGAMKDDKDEKKEKEVKKVKTKEIKKIENKQNTSKENITKFKNDSLTFFQ